MLTFMDLSCYINKKYLTIVDRFSGWSYFYFKVGAMNNMKLINICKDLLI